MVAPPFPRAAHIMQHRGQPKRLARLALQGFCFGVDSNQSIIELQCEMSHVIGVFKIRIQNRSPAP